MLDVKIEENKLQYNLKRVSIVTKNTNSTGKFSSRLNSHYYYPYYWLSSVPVGTLPLKNQAHETDIIIIMYQSS